jgi:glyoxylase-like metal-dependent hydrolase (beta-lactamase superfamily II)
MSRPSWFAGTRRRRFGQWSLAFGLLCVPAAGWAQAQLRRASPFSPTTATTVYPLQRLAPEVYAILGDTGRGVEGRPNAGFVNTSEGIVVVGGLASPLQGTAVVRTIRTVSRRPISWLVLYAHHPDMQFGAISLRRAGAKVIAHPNRAVLAAEAGYDAMVADWDAVVGLQELVGFEYADTPDRPVTDTAALVMGGRRLELIHPGDAHSSGDLMLWLPQERILFAGDILVPDGVTMVVDGGSAALLKALDLIDSLHPRVIVPGHGAIPGDPDAMVARTRAYISELRTTMRDEVRAGHSMQRALAAVPPPDAERPVSLASRRRRNAARVYLEMEREALGFD